MSIWYEIMPERRDKDPVRHQQLMVDLTDEAWHKLWRMPSEDRDGRSCRERLEAIAG